MNGAALVPGIAEVGGLHRRRPEGEYAKSRLGGMALEIDDDAGSGLGDGASGRFVAHLPYIEEAVKGSRQPGACRAAIVRPI